MAIRQPRNDLAGRTHRLLGGHEPDSRLHTERLAAALDRLKLIVGSTPPPVVDERSIVWKTQLNGLVEVSFEVVNRHAVSTTPEVFVIEAAAFGAFIPTVPVGRVAVGSLDPGERQLVSTAVLARSLDAVARSTARRGSGVVPDPSGMTGMGRGHWIGNLNIYPERDPASAKERHCAFDLGIRAGSTVELRLYLISKNRWDMDAASSNPTWSATVRCGRWHRVGVLSVNAPNCVGSTSRIILEVTRVADGKMVPVEFEFETVSGKSDRLGCVTT